MIKIIMGQTVPLFSEDELTEIFTKYHQETTELGTNYLGACFDKNLESFKDSDYLEQMIDEAISESKTLIIELNHSALKVQGF